MITITSVAKTLLCGFRDSSMVRLAWLFVTAAAWLVVHMPLLPQPSYVVVVAAAEAAVVVPLRLPQQLLLLLFRACEAESVVGGLWTC